MAFYISKIKKVDFKGQGSKNYGASNATLLAGKKAGAIVLVHDILKSVIAVILCRILFGDRFGAIAGCCAVIGHIFPFYLRFDGGKGFASFIGASIAVSPLYGIIIILIAIALAALFDYIVAATFSFISLIPVCLFITNEFIVAIVFTVTAAIILIKHRQNLINLITKNGKESKIRPVLFKKRYENKS